MKNYLMQFHIKRQEEKKRIKEYSETDQSKEMIAKIHELHNKKTDITLPF